MTILKFTCRKGGVNTMKDEWRLVNQMKYMKGVDLLLSDYVPTPGNDHDHCEFCWETFSVYDGDLHKGYCTLDRYKWICEDCYEDFKETFEWKLTEA